MSAVLVTDGDQRAALAVVRSLGRAGFRVYVVSPRRRCIAGVSRFALGHAAAPDPMTDPDGFTDEVRRRVAGWGVEVVVPVAEPSLLALLPFRDGLGGARIPFPDTEKFRLLSDKRRVLDVAAQLGIAVPEQRVLHGPEAGVDDVAGLGFPVVVKPFRSVAGPDGGRRKFEVGYAADAEALSEQVRRCPRAAFPLLVQRRILGPGIGIFMLLWEGRVRAVFGHRRIREKPPSGGVSVYCESVEAPATLVALSRALLERFDWSGVAMVEYKLDAATGTPYLMEVNPRFWGSLQLAIDAGVDFPTLLVRAAMGESAGDPPAYRPGIRLRWWWGDVDHLIARARRSGAELALPPDAPSRRRALLEFLRLWRPGDRPCTFRPLDPAPFLAETLDWIRRR